jgi:hypothetical protein
MFDRQVYRGPVIKGKVISAGFYARRENPINLDPQGLKERLDVVRRVLSSSSDVDIQERYSLMARFFPRPSLWIPVRRNSCFFGPCQKYFR